MCQTSQNSSDSDNSVERKKVSHFSFVTTSVLLVETILWEWKTIASMYLSMAKTVADFLVKDRSMMATDNFL